MYNTQLYQVWSHFSNAEKGQCLIFLQSPFFNKNKHIIALGQYVLPQKIETSNPKLHREAIFLQVYGKKDFEVSVFNNLLSDTLHLSYQFLAHQRIKDKDSIKNSLLLETLVDKNWTVLIPKVSRQAAKKLEKQAFRNHEFYYHRYICYEGLDAVFLGKSQHADDVNLQYKSDNFDLYFVINKLRIACDMASRNAVVNAHYECGFLDSVLAFCTAKNPASEQHAAIETYYLVYQMLVDSEKESFYHTAKTVLAQTWAVFPEEEVRTLYSFLLNYCVRKINSGKSNYYREILNLYQFLLQHKIIIRHESITRWTFTNILMAAIRLQEFDWAEQFIRQYEQYLPAQERTNVVTYNLANLYYAKGDFQNALLTLHNVEFNDASYHTGAKIVQLKCYYDMEETEAFYSLIDAFKMYILRSKKLSTYQKRANKNMLRFAKKIFQLKQEKYHLNPTAFEAKLQKLRQRFDKTNSLANKRWIAELLNKV